MRQGLCNWTMLTCASERSERVCNIYDERARAHLSTARLLFRPVYPLQYNCNWIWDVSLSGKCHNPAWKSWEARARVGRYSLESRKRGGERTRREEWLAVASCRGNVRLNRLNIVSPTASPTAFRSTRLLLHVVIIAVVKYGHARNANKVTFAHAARASPARTHARTHSVGRKEKRN